MSRVDDLIWLPSTSIFDGKWSNYVSGMRWKESGVEYENVKKQWAFTDTGSSCIEGPTDVTNFIIEGIKEKVQTTITEDDELGPTFKCDEVQNLPVFELQFGGYWFEVRPEDYLHPINIGGIICAICITGEDRGGWILGSTFLRGWYSIHDYSTGRMGFVPHANSLKNKATHAVQPISTADIVTWSITAVTLILGVISWIFVGGGGALASRNAFFQENTTHIDFPLSKYI